MMGMLLSRTSWRLYYETGLIGKHMNYLNKQQSLDTEEIFYILL